MPYTVTTPPAEEPLTTDEAKKHLNVTEADDDSYIDTLIVAAREYVENKIRRSLIDQEITANFDSFSKCITLERGPVSAISSIKYIDTSGTEQTLPASDYQADLVTLPPRIVAAYGKSWPSAREQLNAVTVVYNAGYLDAALVPLAIKQAMLLFIGHLFENRESVIVGTIVSEAPQSVDALLSPYRVW